MLKKASMTLATLALSFGSTSSFAIPLVYSCEIFDYLGTGVERTEFQYAAVGSSVAYHSDHSTAHVYLDEDHRLAISLRPKASVPGEAFYSSVTGYDLPKRLEVVLANGAIEDGYAARLACRL